MQIGKKKTEESQMAAFDVSFFFSGQKQTEIDKRMMMKTFGYMSVTETLPDKANIVKTEGKCLN